MLSERKNKNALQNSINVLEEFSKTRSQKREIVRLQTLLKCAVEENMPKFARRQVQMQDTYFVDQETGVGQGSTLAQINRLPEQEKRVIYASLIPPPLFSKFHIDPDTFCNADGKPVFRCICTPRTAAVRIELRHRPDFKDPLFLLEMRDTPFGDIEILFLNMNDPSAERFSIDQDAEGQDTVFATISRNIPEEILAMRAGLAPGQVRRGLRLFRSFWVQARQFGRRFGVKQVKVEPLAYHNAVMHEFYGFRYMSGRDMMEQIDRGFLPGGRLCERLDGSTPFRFPGFARSIRGRSWAIHDGILGEPWQCPRMYYEVDTPADRPYDPFTCRISRHYYDLPGM